MYLAVDIGGTKTLFALFSKRGRILRKGKMIKYAKKEIFLTDLYGFLAKCTFCTANSLWALAIIAFICFYSTRCINL